MKIPKILLLTLLVSGIIHWFSYLKSDNKIKKEKKEDIQVQIITPLKDQFIKTKKQIALLKPLKVNSDDETKQKQQSNLRQKDFFKLSNRSSKYNNSPELIDNSIGVNSNSIDTNTTLKAGTQNGSNDGYNNGESLQGVLLRSQPLEKLAQIIQSSISYHETLVENDIQGKVSVEIEVTPQLNLIHWNQPKGTNDTLSAFVIINLLKALDPQGENKLRNYDPKEVIKIDLNFDFQTQILQSGFSKKSHEIIDPKIYFNYTSFREPKLVRWISENLPIIPVPGGFLINVGAVVQIIKNWDKVSPEMRRQQLFNSFQSNLKNQNQELHDQQIQKM